MHFTLMTMPDTARVRSSLLASILLSMLAPACSATLLAQQPFLSQTQWNTLRDEASGSAPYENLRVLTQLHRVPTTPEFDRAADFILSCAREYGLQDAHAEQFKVDGKTAYGLMRTPLGWSVQAAHLWQVQPGHVLLGDWQTDPIVLADYSHSAQVEASLVDVQEGTHDADYRDKNVRGKIVLADGDLAAVQALAVMKYGAAGIVSDMPNQSTAWSGQDQSAIRWGHLDFRLPTGFAFMVSHGTAAALRSQLAAQHTITLKADVQATVAPGHWTVISATIPGKDPAAGEVVYSCHLDHQLPGANDNASGCVTILEVARLLHTLIAAGRLAQPTRTIRFVWGPEIEGTMAYLDSHPEVRKALRADIHMDMVGGDPVKDKAVLHVTQTPWTLPTFVTDIGSLFMETLRTASATYAESGSAPQAAAVEERDGAGGTRNEFVADETPFALGSDHEDYDASTIAVPSLYLRDWPDIHIHTSHDTLDQLDPTKLRRVALLGAAAGYTYATLGPAQARSAAFFFAARGRARLAHVSERAAVLAEQQSSPPADAWYEARNLVQQATQREQGELQAFATYTRMSAEELAPIAQTLLAEEADALAAMDSVAKSRGATAGPPRAPWSSNRSAALIPAHVGSFGPLTYQNDNVLVDRLGSERVAKIRLLNATTASPQLQDNSALYAYEIWNAADGKRSIGEIRDLVSAETGPLDISLVVDYLQACEEAALLSFHAQP